MAFLTDNAVRRRGEDVAIRYCVMCLADGEKVPAVCVIDVGDGDVEAGYCRECAATMKRMGYTLKPLPAQPTKLRKVTVKLTPQQRAEIIAARNTETISGLAARYNVSGQTILNVRKKARVQALSAAGERVLGGPYWQIPKDSGTTAGLDRAGLAAAVAEQGPEAVEEAVEVPDVDVGQDFTYDATIPHPTYYASRIVDGQEIVTEVAPGETEDEAIDRACRQMKERAAPEPPAPVPPFFMPAEEAAEVEFIGAVQSQDLRFREDGTPITNFPAPGTPCEEPAERVEGCACNCHRVSECRACQDCWRHHPDSDSYAYYSAREQYPPAEEPAELTDSMSESLQAMRARYRAAWRAARPWQETDPTSYPVTLDITEEKADTILLALPFEEKAQIVAAKLLERLEAL